MRAAWYEKQGPAREVLVVGAMPDPEPGAGEVRIRVVASGINPGDIKKRQNTFGYGMSFPRVIPHSDGAGTMWGPGSHPRGSASVCGATVRNRIGRSALRRSMSLCLLIERCRCTKASRLSKGLALGYQGSRLTALYMSGDRWRGGPS